jgi:hypothetical protein
LPYAINKKFQPPPRTKKFSSGAAVREKKIEIFQPLSPIALKLLHSRRRGTKNY